MSEPLAGIVRWARGMPKQGFLEVFKSVPQQENPEAAMYGFGFNFEEYSDTMSEYYNGFPKVKQAILSIAGQVVADGVFLVPAKRYNKEKNKWETYPESIEAWLLCEKLNKKIQIKRFLNDISKKMVKYGSCFTEKTLNPFFNIRLVPNQKYMKPRWSKTTATLRGWELSKRYGTPWARYGVDEVALFPWDVDENAPYGTSLMVGLGTDLDSLKTIKKNVNKYVERQAFASNLIQVGDESFHPGPDDIDTITSKVKNRDPGEDLVTGYPINHKSVGPGRVESNMVPDFMEHVSTEIDDGLMIPPISRQVQATEASIVRVLENSRANLIIPIQEIIKSVMENEVYWPYLEDLGKSRRVVPDLMFESPEAGKNEAAAYYVQLVQNGIVTPEQAAEALNEDYDEEYWKRQEELNKPEPAKGIDAKTGVDKEPEPGSTV